MQEEAEGYGPKLQVHSSLQLREAEKYQEKERVKNHNQQYANKVVKETGIPKLNPTNEKKN